MALAQPEAYTEDDYYALPDNIRAELIDGKLYYMVAPSRIHQEILSFLHLEIGNYIRSKKVPAMYIRLRLLLSYSMIKKTLLGPISASYAIRKNLPIKAVQVRQIG